MNFDELKGALKKAYDDLHTESLTELEFYRLLFALFLAEASTLRVVNQERAHLFRPIYDQLPTITLQDIHHLKSSISEMPSY